MPVALWIEADWTVDIPVRLTGSLVTPLLLLVVVEVVAEEVISLCSVVPADISPASR